MAREEKRFELRPVYDGNDQEVPVIRLESEDIAQGESLLRLDKSGEIASERPAGRSVDFRVYLEPDNFFSHEFADSTRWNCYRLTARDSDETLFGYALADSEIAKSIAKLQNRNQRSKTSLILRVNIPQGLQSRRGVVIEKLLGPRWLYVNPPEV